MRRREFITLLGGTAVTWPLAARAQQQGEWMRHISVLMGTAETDPEASRRVTEFQRGLQAQGLIAATFGSNLVEPAPIVSA